MTAEEDERREVYVSRCFNLTIHYYLQYRDTLFGVYTVLASQQKYVQKKNTY